MIVYRLSKGKYYNDLSGKGAEMYGGRWNSKGVALLYCAETRALCFAEVAVHLPVGITPKDYYLITIEFPRTATILELLTGDLPADLRSNPHSDSTQKIGDRFVSEGKDLVLRVPSAVVQGDYNYLINPAHKLFCDVWVVGSEPFEFDTRFFSRPQL